MMKITKEQYQRYQRQIILPEIGIEGQLKIQEAKVLVIGAGGLGCPILLYLAVAGVGTLGMADPDTVAIHNLHRQILHTDADVNRPKVQSAYDHLMEHNRTLQYQVHERAITPENAAELMAPYDIVVDGSDNFATRYLVNDTCVALGKPLVYGSIFNFEGQVSVFNYKGGKQLRDLFAGPPDPGDVPACGENGVLGTLPGIIGNIMAQETLKLIIGLPVLHNELLVCQTLDWSFKKLRY